MWLPLGGGAIHSPAHVARQINTVMAVRNIIDCLAEVGYHVISVFFSRLQMTSRYHKELLGSFTV
jgi:hypothetical protein